MSSLKTVSTWLSHAEILDAHVALSRLRERKVSLAFAYAIARNLRALAPIVETVDEVRRRILQEHLKDNQLTEEGAAQWEELLRKKVEVELLKVKLKDLPSEIESVVLEAILFMIEEEDD